VAGDKVEVFNCYDNKDTLIGFDDFESFTVNGINYTSAALLQAALLDVIYSRSTLGNDASEVIQDNVPIKITVDIEMDDTIFTIPAKINAGPSFTVGETNTVYFNCVAVEDFYSSKVIIYALIGLGKGTYGAGGTPITIDNLQLIETIGGSAGAITNPTTETIEFTTTTSVWQWLNAQANEITIQPQSEGFTIFKGSVNGVATSYLWKGAPGVYGVGELQSVEADFELLEQEDTTVVTDKYVTFRLAVGQSAEPANLAQILNTNVGFGGIVQIGALPIVRGPLTSLILLNVRQTIDDVLSVFVYAFTSPVGAWGYGGGNIVPSMLKYISQRALTVADIEDDVNTVTVDLGTLATDDYLTPLNSVARAFTDVNKTYYVVYDRDGISYTQRFIGTPGTYGGAGTPFTLAMFAAGPTSETPPYIVPTMNQVNAQGNTINNGHTAWANDNGTFVAEPEGFQFKMPNEKKVVHRQADIPEDYPAVVTVNWPAKPADDIPAFISDIEALGSDLPKDFFISGSIQDGEVFVIEYMLGDTTKKTLDFSALITPAASGNSFNEVLRNGNDLFFFGRNSTSASSSSPSVCMALYNCRNVKDYLVYERMEQTDIPLNSRVHGSVFHDGFLYAVTRPGVNTIDTQVIKINPYDLTDKKTITLSGLTGSTGANSIEGYKNSVFILLSNSVPGNYKQRFIKIDDNLSSFEILFEYTSTASLNTNRYSVGHLPFIIYNDEIYIFSAVYGAANYYKASVHVYNFMGDILRSNEGFALVNPNTLTNYFIPHWMTVFNDKLIVTTSSNTGSPRQVLRLDTKSLIVEEQLVTGGGMTDDHSIMSNGMICLNQESSVTRPLYLLKYNDFTNFTEGYGPHVSSGSIDYKHYSRESLNLTNYVKTINGTVPDSAGNYVLPNMVNSPIIIASKAGLSDSVIGSADGTTEKILAVIPVPANTVSKGMLRLDLSTMVSATGLASTKSIRIKTNTSNTLTGASTIASGTVAATSRYAPFERTKLDFTGSAIRSTGLTALTDTAVSTAAISSVSFNPAVTNYIFITGQLASAADDITLMSFSIVNNKEI